MTKIKCDICKHVIENIEFKENEHWKKVACPKCGAEMFVQKITNDSINLELDNLSLDRDISGMPRYCYENPSVLCPNYGMTFCMSPCLGCKNKIKIEAISSALKR